MSHSDEKTSEVPPAFRRKIRSFVKREGRTSNRQSSALKTLFSKYGLTIGEAPVDLETVFQRKAKTVLEIGFGMGDSLAKMAMNHPDLNYIGIEVHRPGVGSLLATIDENKINNIRIFSHDAVEVLEKAIPDKSLDKVQIFFPDPWPKKRHHKRRLIQAPFVDLIAIKLKPDGVLHIATDWENYEEWIEEIMSSSTAFDKTDHENHMRPMTKFEKRGIDLGHGVWDLVYIKK